MNTRAETLSSPETLTCALIIAAGAQVRVEVQPVQLAYRPSALAALSNFASGVPCKTHGSTVLAAINALDSPAARALAKARKTWSSGHAASLTVQVLPLPRAVL